MPAALELQHHGHRQQPERAEFDAAIVAASGTGLTSADSTAVAVAATPTTANTGQAVSITATVTDTATGYTSTIPTGGVTFTDTVGGSTTSLNGGNAVTLNGSGKATLAGVTFSTNGNAHDHRDLSWREQRLRNQHEHDDGDGNDADRSDDHLGAAVGDFRGRVFERRTQRDGDEQRHSGAGHVRLHSHIARRQPGRR